MKAKVIGAALNAEGRPTYFKELEELFQPTS